MSTASTSPGTWATAGSSTSVAGRLLSTLASTAASPAARSSSTRPAERGATAETTRSSPCRRTPSTTTASPRTNARNGGLVSSSSGPASTGDRGDEPGGDPLHEAEDGGSGTGMLRYLRGGERAAVRLAARRHGRRGRAGGADRGTPLARVLREDVQREQRGVILGGGGLHER